VDELKMFWKSRNEHTELGEVPRAYRKLF